MEKDRTAGNPQQKQQPSPSDAVANATSSGHRAVIYLGIDPGLQRTGYALLQRSPAGPVLVEGGIIRSEKSGTLAARVLEIGQGIAELLEEYAPAGVAIEQVFSKPKHPKTAVLMAHARGAILYAVAAFGCPLQHYTPREIKKLLTGSGAASKEQVQQAVQRELRLSRPLEPNDVADACAVAVCRYYSSPVHDSLRDGFGKSGNVDRCSEVRRHQRRQSGEDHSGSTAGRRSEAFGPTGGHGRLGPGAQDG